MTVSALLAAVLLLAAPLQAASSGASGSPTSSSSASSLSTSSSSTSSSSASSSSAPVTAGNSTGNATAGTNTTATATATSSGTMFTVPASAAVGASVLPWIQDPNAKDPQAVCPGYVATLVTADGGSSNGSGSGSGSGNATLRHAARRGVLAGNGTTPTNTTTTTTTTTNTTSGRFTAHLDLAGDACNVYGTDVEHLVLTVEHQGADRVHVGITPRYLGADNASWFELPEALVPRPSAAAAVTAQGNSSSSGGSGSVTQSDFVFSWSNAPTFGFTLTRRSTGDVLFSTNGTKLVFEDQFVEFVSPLPDNYNLYGLGEVMHSFRLGNNLTRTLFAADAADPIDGNIYGSHPFYLDTRYFDAATGEYVANVTAPGGGSSNGSSSSNSTTRFAQTSNRKAANATNTTTGTPQYESYTHGVYLRNAHPQEVLLRPSNITWRTLGGSIDLYFYAGPAATDVLRAYQQTTVGLPAMQQYWTLGYHQSRWGYENWTALQDVVDRFQAADIPLETIWTDIDYMKQYRDFDNDPHRFGYAEGARFLERLHANGQHYVPIVDSAIYVPNPDNASDAYAPYDRGVAADAFLLNPDGSLYVGQVWPGYTVFPDWVGAVLNGTGAFSWWADEMVAWHGNVSFDGIWIDMSEVSSFCVGSCGSHNLSLNPVHPSFGLPGEPGNLVTGYPEGFNVTNATEASSASSVASTQAAAATGASTSSSAASSAAASSAPSAASTNATSTSRNINYPPYVINNVQGDLAVHAVSPNATHHGGMLEYDTHNLFGHQILNATYHALLAVDPAKRPFIIGRSTFAGSGKWAGHWGGDNTSLWAYMVLSIAQALSFSVFGVPMFGVDTCGFQGNSDAELCARWMQLSAFFPFYRNHNTLSAAPQEPYVWAEVADAARAAMAIRYSLLPYLYTLFAEAHASGATVMRALAWEFPHEPWLAAADHQFLLGPALLVTPVLEQGATTVHGVFPGGGSRSSTSSNATSSNATSSTASTTVWYDWYNQTAVDRAWLAPGNNVSLAAPLGHIPLFVRGGYVLPMQQPGQTTAASRANPWSLLVALDGGGGAAGQLYLDDGASVQPNATTWVQFASAQGKLTVTPQGNYTHSAVGGSNSTSSSGNSTSSSSSTPSPPLANVTVLGVARAPRTVSWNGTALGGSQWTYSNGTRRLLVTGLQNSTSGGAWSGPWTLTWG